MPVAASNGEHSPRWPPTPWRSTPGNRLQRPPKLSPSLWSGPKTESLISDALTNGLFLSKLFKGG